VEAPAPERVRWEDIFRGYDIRGRYPEEISASVARRLGGALGRALPGPFLLGRDTRRASGSFARELSHGLRSQGARLDVLGVVPTPEVGFQARRWRAFGLAVTPSHNALGYVGVKGFTPSGRLFDREWARVREAYSAPPGRPSEGPRPRLPVPVAGRQTVGRERRFAEEYLMHLTQGLESDRYVVLDTRGGATARLAPAALRAMGARVVEMTKGFSPHFFGLSPEPRPDTLAALSRRVTRLGADLGFAFDGDGDRCVVVDEGGHRVDPEVVALLLHRAFAGPRSPVVASLDASRVLDRHVRTVRSRVGGRYVTRAMRRSHAEVGVEPSGHYYVRRYGEDSDGILTACLVAHALRTEGVPLGAFGRRFGRLYRAALTVDFPGAEEMDHGFRQLRQSVGARARAGVEGMTVATPEGWCLIRRSNTQPAIRFAYEARGPAGLRRLDRRVRQWASSLGASGGA
jgi:phosphomannomutase